MSDETTIQPDDLQQRYDATLTELEETRKQLESVERRARIDQLLMESDTIDLESARLLTEVAVAQMDEADLAAAVDDVKRSKPFLFRHSQPAGGAMSPRPVHTDAPRELAAQTAAETGHRRDLLRYLRTRRTARH